MQMLVGHEKNWHGCTCARCNIWLLFIRIDHSKFVSVSSSFISRILRFTRFFNFAIFFFFLIKIDFESFISMNEYSHSILITIVKIISKLLINFHVFFPSSSWFDWILIFMITSLMINSFQSLSKYSSM